MTASLRTTSRRLMTNTVLNLANQALAAVINFLLVGFFLDTLGQDRYGIWILVGSIFSYRSLMSMGLNSAVNRHVPVYLASDDTDGIRRVVNTAFAYYMLPATILVAVSTGLYFNLDSWFTIAPTLVPEAKVVAVVLGGSLAMSLPLQVYSAVLSSYQRYDIINVIDVVTMLVRTAIVVSLLSNEFGLVAMSIAYGSAEVIIRFGSALSARCLMADSRISLTNIDRRLLLEMLTYGVSTVIYMSGSVLVFKSADLIIASLISTGAVSQFYVATTPALLMITFIQSFAQAMKPAVSDLDARDSHGRIEEMALITQKYTLMAIIPGVTFLLVMGNAFLTVWVGERFPEPGAIEELALVLQAVALGVGLRLSQHTNFIVLVGKGTHAAFGISALVMVIACVCLTIGSVRVLDAGIVGVAWACCIPMGIISVAVLPIHFSREMKLGLSLSARRSWLPAVVASLPSIGILLFWNMTYPPQSWIEVIAAVAAAASATAVFGWFVALTSVERTRFRTVLPF